MSFLGKDVTFERIFKKYINFTPALFRNLFC